MGPLESIWMAARHLAVLGAQLALLALPGAAGALAVSGGRVRKCMAGACTLATAGYLSLWAHVVHRFVGQAFSAVILLACTAFLWRRRAQLRELAPLLTPLWLWVLAAVLYASLGFLYGGTGDPFPTSRERYFHWEADNELPFVYAAKLLHVPLSPVWDGWNVFQRPPLMTGLVLLLSPLWFAPDGYQWLGMLLQALIVPALWCLLAALPLSTRARRAALFCCIFSIFVLVNAFFVWPKLLAAAFLFFAAAALCGEEKDPWLGGASLGLALLSHGAAAFAALVLGAAFAWRARRARRGVAAVAAVAALYMLPWSIHAHFSGRPSDVLVKWHIGGLPPQEQETRPGESTLQAIYRGYSFLSTKAVLRNKLENLRLQLTPNAELASPTNTGWEGRRRLLIELIFARTPWVVAIPLVAALALAWRRPPRHEAAAVFASLELGALALGALLVWCILMFGPQMAAVDAHNTNAEAGLPQGSYWPPLALLAALAAFVATVSARAATVMVVFQATLFFALAIPPKTGGAWLPLDAGMAACVLLATLGLCVAWVKYEALDGPTSPSPPPAARAWAPSPTGPASPAPPGASAASSAA